MTTPASSMDRLNQATMSGAPLEYAAIVNEGLSTQERVAIEHALAGRPKPRILDLGVGAGRTVAPLRAIGASYVGVDYVQEMVDHCRVTFPGVPFERQDARALTAFADASFDLVFFSCNGISMVDHAGRLAILSEVRRVLASDGAFVFSTCNRNSAQYAARFRFPEFQGTANPAKLVVRAARHFGQTLFRVYNRMRYTRLEQRQDEYAIINDVCHHYQTMLYFISVDAQKKQLAAAGFADDVCVFDIGGRVVRDDCRDGTIAFAVGRGDAQGEKRVERQRKAAVA